MSTARSLKKITADAKPDINPSTEYRPYWRSLKQRCQKQDAAVGSISLALCAPLTQEQKENITFVCAIALSAATRKLGRYPL